MITAYMGYSTLSTWRHPLVTW